MDIEKVTPSSGEIAEAKHFANGWIYRISGKIADPDGAVPPEAIIGAWKVDADGKIVGNFIPNPNHDKALWP